MCFLNNVFHTSENQTQLYKCARVIKLNANIVCLLHNIAQGQLDMEGALTARDHVGIQDFVLLDETTELAFLNNLKKRFSKDLIYVSFAFFLLYIECEQFKDLLCPFASDLHRHSDSVCQPLQGARHLQ